MSVNGQFWTMLLVFLGFLLSAVGPDIASIPDGTPILSNGFIGTLFTHIGAGITGVLTGRLSVQRNQ